MAKHRVDPRRVANGSWRHPFSLIFVLVMLLAGVAVARPVIAGREQVIAMVVAFLPFVVSAGVVPIFGRKLDRDQLKDITQLFFKLATITPIGLVMTGLTLSASVPGAAAGQGLILAGIVAIAAWSLGIEIIVKIMMASLETPAAAGVGGAGTRLEPGESA